jgi:hypothetical protein
MYICPLVHAKPLFSQYLGWKRFGHEIVLLFLSSAEVKNVLMCKTVSCKHVCDMHRDTFPCALLCVDLTTTLER